MPKNNVNDWDSTAANNTDVGGISIAEGMAPANVNNALREIMAQVKSAVSAWINPATTDSRTSDSATTLLQAKAMNDHRTSGDHDGRYAQRNSNLGDLQSAATARTNLGLGSAATAAMGTGAGEIRTNAQNDAQFAPISVETWPGVYEGSAALNTDYPIGSILLVSPNTTRKHNSIVPVWVASDEIFKDDNSSGGTQLSGTWRARGRVSGMVLVQRVS